MSVCLLSFITDLERLDLGKDVKKDRVREVPPYTGFGTEEDSLTSCQGLEPRAPERDFFKFMNKDRLDKLDKLDKLDSSDIFGQASKVNLHKII